MVVPVGRRTRSFSSSSQTSCKQDEDQPLDNDNYTLSKIGVEENHTNIETNAYCIAKALIKNGEKEPFVVSMPENVEGSDECDDKASDIAVWDSDDKWDLPDVQNESIPWNDLDRCGKWRRVLVEWIGKTIAVPILLYFFICSLDFLASAFRLLGGKAAGQAFSSSELIGNPICGLMIGILATVLVQSSSTSTSIVITMVASGLLEVSKAVPIIMGANIGTSVTNTLVSMTQSGDRKQFQRAFAGATVHDMFNWLSVIVLLPLEIMTGYLYRLTEWLVESMELQTQDANRDFLKVITKPFTEWVVMLDKKVITAIALNDPAAMNKSLLKHWCLYEEVVLQQNVTSGENMTSQLSNVTELIPIEECDYLLAKLGLGDTTSGVLLLLSSLALLCTCLILLVKILNSVLSGRLAKLVRKFINSELPGCCSYFTGYLAIIVGAGMTILVQSSSVFTSALTPLVGLGVVKIERMYPLTLGSNIGTTATGLLAALAAPSDRLPAALQIALVHLFFNISGILLFYPIPKMRWPIGMAKKLGQITATYRWFALVYLIVMFFIIPGLVFALSLIHPLLLALVLAVCFLILSLVVILNILQNKCKNHLPKCLQTWEFLPKFMRSLEPFDKLLTKISNIFKKCICKKCYKSSKDASNEQCKKEDLEKERQQKPIYTGSLFPISGDNNDVTITETLLSNEVQKDKSPESSSNSVKSFKEPESGYVTQNATPSVSVFPSRAVSLTSINEHI